MPPKIAKLNSPDDLEAIEESVCLAMAVRAGMELDVFSHLADGPCASDEVAEKIGVDGWRLGRLMYCLVHAGLVEVEDGRFANTEIATRCLVRGMPEYMGSIHELWSELWSAMLVTADSVRTGKPAALHDFSHMSEEELGKLLRGLHAGAMRAGRDLALHLDLGRFGALLDAGGGSGGVALGVCREVETMRATIADLPKVAGIAQGFVKDEGLEDRVSVDAVDLATEVPSGSHDVAILRSLLQTVAPASAAGILANISQAIVPGGEIHVVGRVLKDNRIEPASSVIFDMVFLNFYEGGAAHTFSEHKDWLEAAGFKQVMMKDSPTGSKIVSAVKA